jgi:hypothetical protein
MEEVVEGAEVEGEVGEGVTTIITITTAMARFSKTLISTTITTTESKVHKKRHNPRKHVAYFSFHLETSLL